MHSGKGDFKEGFVWVCGFFFYFFFKVTKNIFMIFDVGILYKKLLSVNFMENVSVTDIVYLNT
jgi:hypothetical protein